MWARRAVCAVMESRMTDANLKVQSTILPSNGIVCCDGAPLQREMVGTALAKFPNGDGRAVISQTGSGMIRRKSVLQCEEEPRIA